GRGGGEARARAIDWRGARAGFPGRVHRAGEPDAPALPPPIVPAPEDASAMDEHRTDGNPALGQAALGLLDRRSEELVHSCPRSWLYRLHRLVRSNDGPLARGARSRILGRLFKNAGQT